MLFDSIPLRGVVARNRAWVSPMCQHSAEDGCATDWHLVHLGARAVGGAGLVMVESTAVRADGRISPYDAGLWADEQIESWRRVTAFLQSQGALAAVQLGHAGRKASTRRSWDGQGEGYLPTAEGGWNTVGPSPIPFGEFPAPRELTLEEVSQFPDIFATAAERAEAAGFDVLELHAAHGYLLHQFLSPLSNRRCDPYGGDFDDRTRLLLEVVSEVRRRWPDHKPLFVRVSATDWTQNGWDADQTVELARRLSVHGVDLVDVSTGGNVPRAQIPVEPGYQIPFSSRIRREAGVPTAAVGLITTPEHAEATLTLGEADAIMIGRAHLDDPYWARRAARALGAETIRVNQYDRPELRAGNYAAGVGELTAPRR